MRWLQRLFRRAEAPVVPLPERAPLTPEPMRISEGALQALAGKPRPQSPFVGLPKPPPGVRPTAVPPGMAMDEAGAPGGAWGAWAMGGLWGEGLFFPGYPYLAELAQRPEYRNISETVAEEMTRKWIKLLSSGEGDKSKQIAKLEDAMKRFGLREAFNHAMELDGFMGMSFIFMRFGDQSDDELMTPLVLSSGKIEKGSLTDFVVVDPTWTSPSGYNSTDPLKPDFFKPDIWFIMGKRVHESRLLIVRSREVPDILKAAYNFGGLSLSQMSKPYVDNWLRARQSVSDIMHSFTVFVLKTNLQALLQNASAMTARITAFILGRDNKGLMLVDKDQEDFGNVSAPLGTLDKLQAQAQEQMASVSQEPLIKLLGITPTGLNATTDGEIRVWYDRVRAKQEKTFGHLLTTALKVLQLNEFGSIDPHITYEFLPLWELDAAGRAAVEKQKADTDQVYMTTAVISNEEVRDRLRGDPESPYHGLKGPAPDPMDVPGMGGGEEDDADRIGREGAEGSESGANSGV
ncbi:MAG: DUF1073 domain-containing protein [Rhodopila sp.]|nr:DUF1073 domain-containing protein [Rhodopila sp.]